MPEKLLPWRHSLFREPVNELPEKGKKNKQTNKGVPATNQREKVKRQTRVRTNAFLYSQPPTLAARGCTRSPNLPIKPTTIFQISMLCVEGDPSSSIGVQEQVARVIHLFLLLLPLTPSKTPRSSPPKSLKHPSRVSFVKSYSTLPSS